METGQPAKRAQSRMSRFKSSISRLIPPPGAASKLLFDQLEPRLLMSADPLLIDLSTLQPGHHDHDVIVRVLDEVVTIDNQTQHLQRIEAIDRNNPAKIFEFAVRRRGHSPEYRWRRRQ
ncbi:LEPR-XLL domain-containing protein [Tardiphaga sp.]|uniref:LEPR-XLL domain-containing protein n=1 Tax=Tardiphaga sp. TaxID=1926292 RepID=UPI0025F1E45D|nr:LEPR-XLL domain-containing protein [Tardiphaga sp.]